MGSQNSRYLNHIATNKNKNEITKHWKIWTCQCIFSSIFYLSSYTVY